jgi:Reverse transcriptase (RNA-dependent DNA polymerase)
LLYQEDRQLQQFETDPIAFALKAPFDLDTMYYHEAMKEKDAPQFRTAMTKEVDTHTSKKHWKLIRRTQVPAGVQVLPAVWAMKRKRSIATREIYIWKVRPNIGGHMRKYGVCLVHALLNGWSTRQLDFVQAYPQAKVSTDNVYIGVPHGVEFKGNWKDFCLHVLQNIYGGKDAGRTSSLHLDTGLQELGFVRSKIDDCLYYRGKTLFLVYVDDGILIDPDPKAVEQAMRDLASKFEIEDGDIDDYLGVKICQGKGHRVFHTDANASDRFYFRGFETTQPWANNVQNSRHPGHVRKQASQGRCRLSLQLSMGISKCDW